MRERLTLEREVAALRELPIPRTDFEQSEQVPRQVRDSETEPPGRTFYVEIDLKVGRTAAKSGARYQVAPMTGIYLPPTFRPGSTVDVLLYLHGYTFRYPGDGTSIDQYWSESSPTRVKGVPDTPFPLRSLLYSSSRSIALVAPSLGPKSQHGTLGAAGGFQAYMDAVLRAIASYGWGLSTVPNIGSLILACHSGGGSPMLKLALSGDPVASRVWECWGFDCLYSGKSKDSGAKLYTQPEKWIRWARANPNRNLYVYAYSTKAESRYLCERSRKRNLANVHVAPSSARTAGGLDGHYWVPAAHWVERLSRSPMMREGGPCQ